MIPESLRTRGVVFAFLFGPPRVVGREEASKLHGAVCDALKRDDIAFRYGAAESTSKPTSRGFSIELERKEGRGGFRALIDHSGAGAPIRLFMEFNWPPSPVHVSEHFDITAEAVFDALDGDWQRVHAEVRMRAQCDVRAGEALDFIQRELMNLRGERLEALGDKATFASVKLGAAHSQQTEDSLAQPSREITVEVLREDPKCLYLELASQWTQVPSGTQRIDLTLIRPINLKPSDYLGESEKVLQDWVKTLVPVGGEGR